MKSFPWIAAILLAPGVLLTVACQRTVSLPPPQLHPAPRAYEPVPVWILEAITKLSSGAQVGEVRGVMNGLVAVDAAAMDELHAGDILTIIPFESAQELARRLKFDPTTKDAVEVFGNGIEGRVERFMMVEGKKLLAARWSPTPGGRTPADRDVVIVGTWR